MMGTFLGWFIELFWRRFFGLARRWINPGFLNGPWLPLYGFGTIALYFISSLPLTIYLKSLIFLIGLTALEYIGGLIFVNIYKIKLWDYSKNKGNIKGIICPFYSVLWTLLGLFFYYVLFPRLQGNVTRLLSHLELSFFIGIYAGVFTVDLFQSFNLANQIKLLIKESSGKWHVDFEKYKLEIRDRIKIIPSGESVARKRFIKPHFLLPFHGESILSLKDGLTLHRLQRKERAKEFLNRENKPSKS
jgi:uncharacterized membrane protein